MSEQKNYLSVKDIKWINKITVVLSVLWLAIIVIFFSWNVYTQNRSLKEITLAQARAYFLKDKAFRLWGSMHGGIYVPVSSETPPSPHLKHVPERDIKTPSNISLTLMNPAYMLRHMNEYFSTLYGISGRITSLKPLRPENSPDAWEKSALLKFRYDIKEVTEVVKLKGERYLRLFKPLVTEKTCLKCHGHQGYKVGDIRGGVGVMVPYFKIDELNSPVYFALLSGQIFILLFGFGGIFFFRGVLKRDYSNRNKLKSEVDKMNVNLEDRVKERTAELEIINENLNIAKIEAEDANNAKSQFLSNVSHELRTPLNAIMGFAQILKIQKNISSSQKNQINIIYESGNHLLTIISNILDVSRIDAKKQSLDSDVFNLNNVLALSYNMSKIKASEKEIDFTLDIKNTLPESILGDKVKVKQILLNLMSNAIKYTDHGSIIMKGEYNLLNEMFSFKIADTGCGIPLEKINEIFLPFIQLEDGEGGQAGTSLGLTITKALVEMMNGDIAVHSEPGKGSVFSFSIYLPLCDRDAVEADSFNSELNITGYKGERKSILVIDDNQTNISLLVDLLEPLGFEINFCENGQEGIEKLKKTSPDLILLDYKMPVMGGIEFAKNIHENEEYKDIKIIGISATVIRENNKSEFAEQCNFFLTKPVDNYILLKAIGCMLNLTWVADAPEIIT